MNYTTIANVLGKLLIVTGSSLIFPIICSLYYKENDLYSLVFTAVLTIAAGLPLYRYFRRSNELN